MGVIKECFEIILMGDAGESRAAARRVRKLLYSSKSDKDSFSDIKNVIDGAFGEYYKITEDWRQENFVVAFSVIYFLHDTKHLPDFLFPWFLQLLQHSNGYIRYAAVKMITGELGPLTIHIRFPGDKMFLKEKLTPEEADKILFSLSVKLHNLLILSWFPKYKKYKYIDSLPPSPYKSVQMVLAEMEDMCEKEYLNNFREFGNQ